MIIQKNTLRADTVGVTREPMVIGTNLKGSQVCITTTTDINEARRLVNSISELRKQCELDNAYARQRGWKEEEICKFRFV